MSYYKKNIEVLLEKAYYKCQNRGGKERARKYYQENKEEIKKKEILKYWFMPESDKEVIRQRSLKNGGKNMSFKIEDNKVYLKYNEI